MELGVAGRTIPAWLFSTALVKTDGSRALLGRSLMPYAVMKETPPRGRPGRAVRTSHRGCYPRHSTCLIENVYQMCYYNVVVRRFVWELRRPSFGRNRSSMRYLTFALGPACRSWYVDLWLVFKARDTVSLLIVGFMHNHRLLFSPSSVCDGSYYRIYGKYCHSITKVSTCHFPPTRSTWTESRHYYWLWFG